jgi:hypothetical protein
MAGKPEAFRKSGRQNRCECRHGAPPAHVILRSPPFFLADDEGSPQFVGSTRPLVDGLPVQRNCRDSSAPKERGASPETR